MSERPASNNMAKPSSMHSIRTRVSLRLALLQHRLRLKPRGHTRGSHQSRGRRGERRDILYPNYRINPAKRIVVGRVFHALWAEPAGRSGAAISKYDVLNQLGQRVFSKIQRFVVVRKGPHYCIALPVFTYNGQGVAELRVVDSRLRNSQASSSQNGLMRTDFLLSIVAR